MAAIEGGREVVAIRGGGERPISFSPPAYTLSYLTKKYLDLPSSLESFISQGLRAGKDTVLSKG